MGAIHNVAPLYYTASHARHPAMRSAGRSARGPKMNFPMIGPGDYFQFRSTTRKAPAKYVDDVVYQQYSIPTAVTYGIGIGSDGVFALWHPASS